MSKPLVVIVGRPNVGKSTLFNKITGSQSAIVENIPGVTRDRHYLDAEWEGKSFTVVDTGGFYPEPSEDMVHQVREQAMFAVEESDLIIHLMDGKDGLTHNDLEIAKILRASGKKILWAVNKIDGPAKENRLYEFYKLGADEILPVSAQTGYEFGEFMDKAAALLPDTPQKPDDSEYPGVAVVGRPNVGKSTLVNTLLGKNRMIVSPAAGTTRDAIDSVCTYYKRGYLLIDTAGIRKKGKTGYSLERFSMVRAVRSIERCDVALIVLDAEEGISEQDKRIAGIVHEYGKGAVFLFNKWDMVKEPDIAYKKYEREFQDKFWFFNHAPMLTISGLDRRRVTKAFQLIDGIVAERDKRITTGELNNFLRRTTAKVPQPVHKGRQVKLYYMTQTGTKPPAFVLFTSQPEGLRDSYIKFIERSLREAYSFRGTPIRIFVRGKV